MLTALGLAAVIVAGFALPLAMSDGADEDGEDGDAPAPAEDPPPDTEEAAQTDDRARDGGARSPLDVALGPDASAAADDAGADSLFDAGGVSEAPAPGPPAPGPSAPGPAAPGQDAMEPAPPETPAEGASAAGPGPDMQGAPAAPDSVEPVSQAGEGGAEPLSQAEADSGPGLRLDGGATAEMLVGTEGADDIAGGLGDDTLRGAGGADLLFGGGGDDLLEGGAGDDRLVGGHGADTLSGGPGDDRLIATPADGAGEEDGPDSLDGGAGDDTLILSPGDIATGGPGADRFVTGPGLAPPGAASGAAEITDFDPHVDALVVVWNDYASDAPPEITLSPSATADAVEVRADGEVVARVAGTGPVAPSDVHLLPTSHFVA